LALLIQQHAAIFTTWCVTTAIALTVILWPFILKFINREFRPAALDEPDVNVQ
jgi:hypothetical protein